MSYFIMRNGLAATSPLIKATDRQAFSNAVALLDAAREQANNAEAIRKAGYEEAYQKGFTDGLRDAEEKLQAEIQKFADALSIVQADYEARVAEAAFAATKAIIGSLDDETVIIKIVETQLSKRADNEALRIQVAQQFAPALAKQLSGKANIEIVADSDMPPAACRLVTPDGRIVADLSLQLETLQQRWGLSQSSDEDME
jgi:type III secretion protein L